MGTKIILTVFLMACSFLATAATPVNPWANYQPGGFVAANGTLPAEATCTASITRYNYEPRTNNYTPNHTVPTAAQLLAFRTSGANDPASSVFSRVTGNFKGTTSEILRWGACKWGFSAESVRAIAAVESWWRQATVGDPATTPGSCPAGTWDGTTCYESYGLMQVRYPFHPWAFPIVRTSTAFNVDYKLAYQRACMDGKLTWLSQFPSPVAGYGTYPNANLGIQFWGCVGFHYSGRWYDTAALAYIAKVKQEITNSHWKLGTGGFFGVN